MFSSTRAIGLSRRRNFLEANNYAGNLCELGRFEESKSLLRRTMPVARRVLGESDSTTLRMRWNYAVALYRDPDASLDDFREAVTTLEDVLRTTRRVFGVSHPRSRELAKHLQEARLRLNNPFFHC